jgi:hypothetical protein
LQRHALRHSLRRTEVLLIAAEFARKRIIRCHGSRLQVVLVDDQIRLEVVDARTFTDTRCAAGGYRTRLDALQGFMQLRAIVREIGLRLAGDGKNRDAIRRLKRALNLIVRDVSDLSEFPERKMHIVEEQRDKSRRSHKRRRRFLRIGRVWRTCFC